jgi:hypothetical protein
VRCPWYGSFHARAVTVVLARDQHTTSGYDLALVTTDGRCAAGPAQIVSRYAMRWPVERAFADARNVRVRVRRVTAASSRSSGLSRSRCWSTP